jgi:hypothetical protein
MRHDYAADLAEQEREAARTPIASALLSKCHAVLNETLDEATREELKMLAFSIGAIASGRNDVNEDGAAKIEARIRELSGPRA